MTEETNQTVQATNTGTTAGSTVTTGSTTTDQTAQATNTASFVPDWQAKSDKLKEAVQQGYGMQVVYKSTNEEPCEPTLVTERQASDNYPFVVEEPVGFIAPKFLWNGTTRGWIETANIQQGKVLAEVQNKIAELQQQVTDFGKTAGQVDNVNKQVQTQLGQLLTMVSSLVASNKSEAQTTAQTTSSQPAQAATANTATTANTTASTESTQPDATTTTSTGSTQPTTAQTTNA